MAVPKEKLYTVDDLKKIAARPENTERLFELIAGEIIEVSPGRTWNSEIGQLISFAVQLYCRQQDLPCHTSGGDGAYQIGDDVVAPDFAYKRIPTSRDYPDPVPPELAVEVISPTDKAFEIRDKRTVYVRAGILVWEVYPQSNSVDVYAPGQPVQRLGLDDVLTGGEVLPGFTLKVAEIFPQSL
jgi:Uma2 family endonuclease